MHCVTHTGGKISGISLPKFFRHVVQCKIISQWIVFNVSKRICFYQSPQNKNDNELITPSVFPGSYISCRSATNYGVLTTFTASVMILCVRTYRDDEVPDVSWTRGYLVTWTSSLTHGEHVVVLVTIYLAYYIWITTRLNKTSKIFDRSQNGAEIYLKIVYCRF